MNPTHAVWVTLCVGAAFSQQVFGDGPASGPIDKSSYTLFDPTPIHLMRQLSADRPDGTESPITVDAGHVQVELSFADYTHDDEDGTHTDATAWLDTNIKFGITHAMDLQLIFAAYSEEDVRAIGQPNLTLNGFSDVTIRLKINLWGNDGGQTAFGIMPFVKIPTGTELSNDEFEGGFIAMLGWDVAETWGLGVMAEIDAVYDSTDDDHDTEFIHTVVIGFDVVGPLGAYVEYIGNARSDGDYVATFSAGLTYAVSDNVVFDTGVMVGLNDAADDFRVFVGLTWRR